MALFNATLFPPNLNDTERLHAPPVMRSEQEQLVENYINNSFGSFFLYSPINYKYRDNGKTKSGEPCDLFWYCEGLVVMFSMTKTKRESADKQTKHNVQQLQEYMDRWETGDSDFDLCGKNRFGEICRVQYSDVESLVLVSLIGKRCGLKNLKSDPEKRQIWLNAPSEILKMLADANASLVDFLNIALKPHRMGEIERFDGLCKILKNYVLEGLRVEEINKVSISKIFEDDIAALQHYLESPKTTRAGGSLVFLFDLTLRQRTDLLTGILLAIKKSCPPNFSTSGVMEVRSYYYFTVITGNGSDHNLHEALTLAFNMSKNNDQCGRASVQIVYGNCAEGEDFRKPVMISESKRNAKVLQAKYIYDFYLRWKSRKVPVRTDFSIETYQFKFKNLGGTSSK